MTLDERTISIAFEMARHMARARGGSPKYIVSQEPEIGKPLEILEYMGTKKVAEYTSTGEIIPREIIIGSGEALGYYFVVADDCQMVVHQSRDN